MRSRAVLLGLTCAVGGLAFGVVVASVLVGGVPLRVRLDSSLLPVVITGMVVAAAAWPVADADAQRWLARRDLPSGDRLVQITGRWLRHTRMIRAIGFAVPASTSLGLGYLINTSPIAPNDPRREALFDLMDSWPLNGWAPLIVGYALGAIIAGVVLRPASREDARRRIVDLRRRDPSTYLQGFSRHAPRITATATLASVLLLVAVPDDGSTSPAAIIGATVAVLALHEAALRWMVRRPQHAASPELLALDDATRAATVQAVAGSALGVLGLLLGDTLWAVAFAATGPPLRWLALPATLLPFIAVGVWLGHGLDLAHVVVRDGDRSEPRTTVQSR